MSLSGSRLEAAEQDAIRAELEAQFKPQIPWDDLTTDQKAGISAGWDSMAAAMAAGAPETVTEITGHAQVPAGIAVATTGSAAAQTGATTAPGTIL